MRILLDTQCWLWVQAAPNRFSSDVLHLLRDRANDLFLSAASCWEIAIKYALGRLSLPVPPADYVPSRMASSGTSALRIEPRHALHIATLPQHHRDPFDRLLIAQAQLEGFVLLTADRQLAAYDVTLRWAD